MKTRLTTFICDPEKNTKCTKTHCYINGGECRQTTNKDYAVEDEQHESKVN